MKHCNHCGGLLEERIPAGDNRMRLVCSQCGAVHYQNPRVVAGCLATWEGKVLLCQRAIEPRKGYWTLPAGFMENGETTTEAAARETFEEAGATVQGLELYTLFDLPHIDQIYMLFRGELVDGRFGVGEESLGLHAVLAALFARADFGGRREEGPVQVVHCLQAVERFTVGQRVGLVGLREAGGIDQLHAGGDLQAAGTTDHHQARHAGLACDGSQLRGDLADAADVIARARAVGTGQHVVAGDGGNQRVLVIQRSDHRMGAGQFCRKVLRAAHDDSEFVAAGQRVAGDLAADVAGGTNEGDFHAGLRGAVWGGNGATLGCCS